VVQSTTAPFIHIHSTCGWALRYLDTNRLYSAEITYQLPSKYIFLIYKQPQQQLQR